MSLLLQKSEQSFNWSSIHNFGANYLWRKLNYSNLVFFLKQSRQVEKSMKRGNITHVTLVMDNSGAQNMSIQKVCFDSLYTFMLLLPLSLILNPIEELFVEYIGRFEIILYNKRKNTLTNDYQWLWIRGKTRGHWLNKLVQAYGEGYRYESDVCEYYESSFFRLFLLKACLILSLVRFYTFLCQKAST